MKAFFWLFLALQLLFASGCTVVVGGSGQTDATPVPGETSRPLVLIASSPTPPPTMTPTVTATETAELAALPPTATEWSISSPLPSMTITETDSLTDTAAPAEAEVVPTEAPAPTSNSNPPASPTPSRVPATATSLPPTATQAVPTATTIPTMTRTPVAAAAVSGAPPAPSVRETEIVIDTYQYVGALVSTAPGDAIYPYPRLDHGAVGLPAPRTYRAVVLENSYVELTILPELGGRLYRWVDKASDKNLFYENPVIKPTDWGPRGWWLAAGGMEWAFPIGSHGLSEASPWGYDVQQGAGVASVTVYDTEERTGLHAEVTITVDSERAGFTLTPRLSNPTDARVPYQFWLNGMFGLGSVKPRQVEFLLPGDRVRVDSVALGQSSPRSGSELAWPGGSGQNLANYASWNGHMGLSATIATGKSVMGAYNHETDLGVVRVYPGQIAPGARIFGPKGLDPSEWTDDGSSYVELWGGTGATFDEVAILEPGAAVTWTEAWYAVHGTGGIDGASDSVALNVEQGAGNATLAVSSARPMRGAVVLESRGQELGRWALEAVPGEAATGSIPSSVLEGDAWELTVRDEAGALLLSHAGAPATRQGSGPSATPVVGYPPATTAVPTYPPAATPIVGNPAIPTPITGNPAATPVPARHAPPGSWIGWDPRLDDLGITVLPATPSVSGPTYRLVSARYLDESESGGTHHIYIEVVDREGRRKLDQTVVMAWRDGQSEAVTEDKPSPEYAANFPMYNKLGAYSAFVGGGASDVVQGLGLPEKLHVSYQLIFQEQ